MICDDFAELAHLCEPHNHDGLAALANAASAAEALARIKARHQELLDACSRLTEAANAAHTEGEALRKSGFPWSASVVRKVDSTRIRELLGSAYLGGELL